MISIHENCIENKNNYEILTYNSFKPVGLGYF